MFGFEVEQMNLQPVEIEDTVYVPYHIEAGGNTLTTYLTYEKMLEQIEQDDELGTDDYRYDL